MNKIKSITIIGRRWFEKVNGNTYHSVTVYVDGKLIEEMPFAYGYGTQYLQSAEDILDKKGIVNFQKYPNGSREPLWRWARENNVRIVDEVIDVARRKDL